MYWPVKSSNQAVYIWIAAAFWTVITLISFAWSIRHENKHLFEEAYVHAKLIYDNDVRYRRWAAGHGGVYVPVTEQTPPSPYLSHIPERDVRTPSGRLLTLINPAYMTRQVHKLLEDNFEIRGHITSLNPVSPENAPDPWEKKALQSFEEGESSVSSVEMMDDRKHFRVMFPLVTKEPCLKCHAAQGYKTGDMRGGISVSIPLDTLDRFSKDHIFNLLISHLIMWFLVMGAIIGAGIKFIRADRMRGEAAEEMKDLNRDLSVLFKISSTINRTMDFKELLSNILNTITEIGLLNVEKKGGIFILEGERMELVSHLGHPDLFIDLHKEMKIGDCLCGKAAETGEIIISKNSENDPDHTISYPGMNPHGHIIIPLKSKGEVLGVLYLYLHTDFEMDEEKINLFTSISDQVGIAIANAKLYEKTKRSSLHDPLTGLANRRSMDIEFKRNLAMTSRFARHFSLVMLDLDHFKEFNDKYGHTAGDTLLVTIAGIISRETRESDLAVRFGGEEFLIIMPHTELEQALNVAERIRTSVEKETRVTVSIGISSSRRAVKKKDLIEMADRALYQAKLNGRNRVEVYG